MEFATKVDGEWETIPWKEVCEWIEKQYAIERRIKNDIRKSKWNWKKSDIHTA
jgi:hypothetical protein